MNSEVGSQIRRLRKEIGMSITELAERSGVSRPYLSQVESGKRKPSIEILKKTSEALMVNFVSFLIDVGYITKKDMENFKEGASNK